MTNAVHRKACSHCTKRSYGTNIKSITLTTLPILPTEQIIKLPNTCPVARTVPKLFLRKEIATIKTTKALKQKNNFNNLNKSIKERTSGTSENL
jgi:hypothetical protein